MRLTWSWGPADSRLVRVLLYVPPGLIGGLALVALGRIVAVWLAAGWLAVGGVEPTRTEVTTLLVILVVFLVAAVLYFGQMVLVERGTRRTLTDTRVFGEFYRMERLHWHVLAALIGAGLYLVVAATVPGAWPVVFVGGLAVSLIGVHLLGSAGELDPSSRTLTYDDHEIDLASVTAVRRLSLGERAVVWLSSPRERTSIRTPGLLVLPTRVADELEAVVERGTPEEAAARSDAVESADANPVVRAVSFILALGFLGFAGVLSVLLYRRGLVNVALAVSLILATFGVLFLWLAAGGS